MKFSAILKEAVCIMLAFCSYWSSAVSIGLILYAIFPPYFPAHLTSPEDSQIFSYLAGISLGEHWQNIPGNIIGFIVALYTFRSTCSKKTNGD